MSDGGLLAPARLAVYANAYFVRIHDCLREDFGALASVLGEAVFHDLVKTYLMLHPPSRASLRHVGAKLTEHLRTEPFAAMFSKRCAHAADLADLEWAITEAFYAQDAPAIGPEALASIPLDAWAELRLDLTPSLRIIRCAWPVHRVRGHFDEQVAPPPGGARSIFTEPTQIRVWRNEERVCYRSTSPLEADALELAAAGDSFAAICDRVAESVADADAPRVSAELLASWFAVGLVVGRHRRESRANESRLQAAR